MSKEIINELNSGSIHITTDVIEAIAEVEASKIEGVTLVNASMVDRISGNFKDKDIDVNLDGRDVYITINIGINYGVNIIEISKTIQENVIDTIRTMTGLEVVEINIIISKVNVVKEPKE